MTITTAKSLAGPRSSLRRLPWLPLAPLALGAMLCGQAQAQPGTPAPSDTGSDLSKVKSSTRWKITPRIDFGTTLTDNVARQPDQTAHSQLIHEISPGFDAVIRSPRVRANASYELHQFMMYHSDAPGTRRNSHTLRSAGKAELLDDMLYVDASANMTQSGISPFGQEPSRYSTANTANVKSWRISPYLRNRFGRVAMSEVRYTRDGVSAGRSGLADSNGDTLSVMLRSGRAWEDLGFVMNASEQTLHSAIRNDSTIQTGNFNLNYQVLRTLNVTAGVNYDSYDYESLGGANRGNGWNSGFTWTPSRRTSLMVNNGRRYYGPSRTLKATHRSRHTVWNISYDDSVTSTRANFLIPTALDTALLLDGLFTPSFPDPTERALAVADYIRNAGLPPTIVEDINFFSNRFSLQKQLRATMAFRQARTTVIYSAYRVRREALSTSVTDSLLLGSSTFNLNDNVDQKGIGASLSYALNGKTSVSLQANISDNESLTTAFKARTTAVRLGFEHRLQTKAKARIELRRNTGVTGVIAAKPYTENAISAFLNLQY